MKTLALCAGALLALTTLAHAGPEQDLARVLSRASKSSNPSVSFLEGIGALGNVDMSASQVQAAVQAAPVHPGLLPIVQRITRLRIQGSQVNFSFSQAFSLNLQGHAYAHFSRNASFRLADRTLTNFSGFKLSRNLNGLRATPTSIRFGSHQGVPSAWVTVPVIGTRRVPLVTQTAGLLERLRVG